jgi:hypothetical protein
VKRLMSVFLGLSLLVPIAGFAQTGGDKEKKEAKGHKGGKKSKKGSGPTTPPPK